MMGYSVEFGDQPTPKSTHIGQKRVRVQRTCQGCGRVYWAVPSENRLFCKRNCRRPILEHPTDPTAAIIQCSGGEQAIIDKCDIPIVESGAWRYGKTGRLGKRYVVGKLHGKRIQLHRAIFTGDPGLDVDHIDLDTLNNRRSNLRQATRSQNCANKSVRRDSLTGFKGVTFRRKRGVFEAYINKEGKRFHLGVFRDATEAAKAYDVAAVALYGEFARPNLSNDIGRDAA